MLPIRLYASSLVDKSVAVYLIGRKIIKLCCRLFYQLDVVYEAKLPSGPKIFAVNHPTTLDPFIITTLSREPLVTLIQKNVFSVPVFGRLLSLTGNIPVSPGSGQLAFDSAVSALRSGKNVAVFIEGGLSRPQVSRPHTGAARLSVAAGCPIIPIGVAVNPNNLHETFNTFGGNTDRTVWYHKGPYAVTLGRPMTVHGSLSNRSHIRSESVRIFAVIRSREAESHRRLLNFPQDFSLLLHWFRLAYAILS